MVKATEKNTQLCPPTKKKKFRGLKEKEDMESHDRLQPEETQDYKEYQLNNKVCDFLTFTVFFLPLIFYSCYKIR